MKLSLMFVGIAMCLSIGSPTLADEKAEQAETTIIPLKEIWAYGMPGTRDARSLEPDEFEPSSGAPSSREQIKITGKSKQGQSAPQAFAVAGTGRDALREAKAVLSGKKKPQTSFPADSNVSVVFFSHSSPYYVHLDKVEQQPGLVVISYRFIPHETADLTRHFALIPLRKLPLGNVRVDMKRLPLEKKFLDAGFTEPSRLEESQIVAQSFSFTVKEKVD